MKSETVKCIPCGHEWSTRAINPTCSKCTARNVIWLSRLPESWVAFDGRVLPWGTFPKADGTVKQMKHIHAFAKTLARIMFSLPHDGWWRIISPEKTGRLGKKRRERERKAFAHIMFILGWRAKDFDTQWDVKGLQVRWLNVEVSE